MKESFTKRLFRIIKEKPFSVPVIIFSILICNLRSRFYSLKIDGGGGKIIITKPFMGFKIIKHKTAQLYIEGDFRVIPHIGGSSQSAITMAANSRFQIFGDFVIGQGVLFFLHENSSLKIGGKEKESDSGITCDTSIMVYKNIEIGKDFLCAWNVFISDCDWHSIAGQSYQADVIIGDHVWIANSSSILKGAIINENCIVASHSKVSNNVFPKNSMLAGVPCKVIKMGVGWGREIGSH